MISSTETFSRRNRFLQTWPFRRRENVTKQSNIEKIGADDPEYKLGRQTSLGSIFMTVSSKNLAFDQLTISDDLTTDIIQIGDGSTAKYKRKLDETEENLQECSICCESQSARNIKRLACCSIIVCRDCLRNHLTTMISQRQNDIFCVSCSEKFDPSQILYDQELTLQMRERYQQILAQSLSEEKNTHVKLCPHCNFITIVDEKDSQKRMKMNRSSKPVWVHCEQCEKDWCWPCYSPAHPNLSCEQYRKNQSDLRSWAKARRVDNDNQRNARKCPKCSIYIEKISGCDHMSCSECNSKFCYRCGGRMRLPFFIGHDVKYSIFGCKYKLWPDRPILRWIVRGSVFTGVLLLTPILLAVVLSLVAVGVPTVIIIGCLGLPVFICLECKKRT